MVTAFRFWSTQLTGLALKAGPKRKSTDPPALLILATSNRSGEAPVLVTLTSCSSNWPTGMFPKLGGLLAVNAEVAARAAGASMTAGTRPTADTAAILA